MKKKYSEVKPALMYRTKMFSLTNVNKYLKNIFSGDVFSTTISEVASSGNK